MRARSLTEVDADLLDRVDFGEGRYAFVTAGVEAAGLAAGLAATAFTAQQVASGLDISLSRVRQKRLAGELWAISDGRRWLFPLPQFQIGTDGGPRRQVRGLDRVLRSLPENQHPLAVAGFLRSPQPRLFDAREMTVVEWLLAGGDVQAAVNVAVDADWHTT